METGRVLGRQETGSGRVRSRPGRVKSRLGSGLGRVGIGYWSLELEFGNLWISGLIGKEGWWAFCDWALVWSVCVLLCNIYYMLYLISF